jgi:flavin reductase (DIM6/NTAB) family NADH-FMN oxidoreductase RutF
LFFDPAKRDKTRLPHDPFKALIAPRPIGWISTMSLDGSVNLAPYSFFNAFSADPALIGFCSEGRKDSMSFAVETKEFVWNLATYDLRFQMNETSAPLSRGESEFSHAGLETLPSVLVRPPRVKESPAHMECRVVDVFQLHDMNGTALSRHLVIGQVIGIHIDDDFIDEAGIVQVPRMKPIARCGYQDYSILDEVFALKRPPGGGNAVGGG